MDGMGYCWWFRNPANQLRLEVEIPFFTTSQVVQDFFQQHVGPKYRETCHFPLVYFRIFWDVLVDLFEIYQTKKHVNLTFVLVLLVRFFRDFSNSGLSNSFFVAILGLIRRLPIACHNFERKNWPTPFLSTNFAKIFQLRVVLEKNQEILVTFNFFALFLKVCFSKIIATLVASFKKKTVSFTRQKKRRET